MHVYGKYECFVMQMLYVCVHPVAVLNIAFCMTYRLLMLVDDAKGDHMEDTMTLSQHTNMQHKQQYTHISHNNHRIHNNLS